MAGETVLTVIGNLVDDPTLRFTPSGAAVSNFRVASTPRSYDSATGQWADGEPTFLSCSAWRQMGENIVESLRKGDRVILQGRLRQREYETTSGEKRTVYEVEVDEIGPSVKFRVVAHGERQAQRSQAQDQSDPWSQQQQQGGGESQPEDPPF